MISYQQRGTPISPSAFNALVDMVKSSLITGVTGGTFTRSAGGTVINVALQGGGVAGEEAGTACQYFKVTDASEGTQLKVEVAQNQIAGRWPDGMGLGFPPYKLDIGANSYIYAKVTYNTTTLTIPEDSTAITILQSSEIEANTVDSVYILLATVEVGGNPIGITKITNVCSEPVPNPCNLAWTE